MKLEGSCHCGAVRFTCDSNHPVPYQRCYCSICRKTAGGGGYAINISARSESLDVEGEDAVGVYHATIGGEHSTAQRRFCTKCGSALWLYDPTWPELIHPHASAIDTPLPVPSEHTHLLIDSKASWVEVEAGPRDKTFDGYPDESIAHWHERTGNAVE
ncbi:MAG: GFA family protein [Rhizobiaceae bacterium]